MAAPHRVRPERRVPRDPSRRSDTIVAATVATFLVFIVGVPIALLAYRQSTECPSYRGEGDPGMMGFSVTRGLDNWTVTLVAGIRDLPEDSMSIEIVDSAQHVLLPNTLWLALTESRWSTNHVTRVDNHPGLALVCEGDLLLVDSHMYPFESVIRILRGGQMAGWANLF